MSEHLDPHMASSFVIMVLYVCVKRCPRGPARERARAPSGHPSAQSSSGNLTRTPDLLHAVSFRIPFRTDGLVILLRYSVFESVSVRTDNVIPYLKA